MNESRSNTHHDDGKDKHTNCLVAVLQIVQVVAVGNHGGHQGRHGAGAQQTQHEPLRVQLRAASHRVLRPGTFIGQLPFQSLRL